MNNESERRFYLCVTCGHLKSEDLFREGDCTCQDCYKEGREEVNWQEADDGDGYVFIEREADDER